MRVKRFSAIELSVTEFDDGVRWMTVTSRQQGQRARTLWWGKTERHFDTDDLDYGLALVDDLCQDLVNRERGQQLRLC